MKNIKESFDVANHLDADGELELSVQYDGEGGYIWLDRDEAKVLVDHICNRFGLYQDLKET